MFRYAIVMAVQALLVSACTTFNPANYLTIDASRVPARSSYHNLPIETGQIILIERPGAASLFLSLVAQEFEPFIHAGIIVLEDDVPYVYESFGTISPYRSGSPTDKMGGGVRRVSLDSFLARDGFIAIYDPPAGVDRSLLEQFVRAHAARHTSFDGHFDSDDPASFYCVEFVARALTASGAAPIPQVELTSNRSTRVVLDWLHISTPTLWLAGKLTATERRALLIARRHTPSEIETYFALKRELHRRFTTDQKLGNLFYWRLSSLHLRPAIDQYFKIGMAANAPNPTALASQVFELAAVAMPTTTANGR